MTSEQPDTERYYKLITARRANIAINLLLCGLFAFAAFHTESWWATVMMAWSSGAQFGFAAMWWISPHITERWRREMRAEVELAASRAMLQSMRDGGVVAWSPTIVPPDDAVPNPRKLQ